MSEKPDLFGSRWRWCAFCGGQTTTSDHVPARVFLDLVEPHEEFGVVEHVRRASP